MSWLRGKKASVTNLKAEESANRSTTPTPSNPDGKTEKRTFRSGLLTIRVMGAEGVGLPAGTSMPPAVKSALTSQQAKVAASVSPSSVNQQRLANRSKGSRCVVLGGLYTSGGAHLIIPFYICSAPQASGPAAAPSASGLDADYKMRSTYYPKTSTPISENTSILLPSIRPHV